MKPVQIFLCVACILLITVGQSLLKKAVGHHHDLATVHDMHALLTNVWLWLGFGVYGICFVLYLILLRGLPLAYVYPVFALTFITVPVTGLVVFGEKMTPYGFAGGAFIVLGIYLISRQY
ncbi:MAG: EamA family transporter [Gammaproteobacteria bacterium]